MCYSNCKNENFNGECSKKIDIYDTDLHCFIGFVCKHCREVYSDPRSMSEIENLCLWCEQEREIDQELRKVTR